MVDEKGAAAGVVTKREITRCEAGKGVGADFEGTVHEINRRRADVGAQGSVGLHPDGSVIDTQRLREGIAAILQPQGGRDQVARLDETVLCAFGAPDQTRDGPVSVPMEDRVLGGRADQDVTRERRGAISGPGTGVGRGTTNPDRPSECVITDAD